MVGLAADVTGTLSTLRERWGAGIVRVGLGAPGLGASREPAVSMGALALAPLPSGGAPTGAPDTSPDATRTSTGFRMLDGLIGGLPRQGTVAIVGGPSSGATTLTLRAVAEAQATGAIAAWLDLPGRFDPLEAAERGVDLRWLVVVRPTRSADGLRIVGAMLASRSIDLLVLDLPSRMPTDQAGLVRQLGAQARRVGGRVLAIGSGSLTPVIRDALAESSHLRLALAHRDWLRVGREVVGQRVTVTVEKDRAGAPGRATEIEIRYQPDGERGAAVGRLLDAAGENARGAGETARGAGPPGPGTPLDRPGPLHCRLLSTFPVSSMNIDRPPPMRYLHLHWNHLPLRIELRSPSLPSGPVVLGGQPWEPGSVLDASPAALRMGVQRGQPLGSAHALAPEATFLDAHPDRYREVLEAALEALLAVTPAVEGPVEPTDPAFGRVLLGIEGLERLWGDEAAIVRRALTAVGALLPGLARAGVGNTRFGSSVAASMEASIPVGDAHVEAAWLAPQTIGYLPADADTHGRFRRFGLTRIGDLAALPRSAVVARFGQHGGTLHDLALGLDARPLRPRRPVERLRAQLELESPIDGTEPLRFILHSLCAGLCAQLVARGAAVTTATLTLTLEDAAASGPEVVQHLPEPVARPEPIERLLLARLDQMTLAGPIAHVALELDGRAPGAGQQLTLFEPQAARADQFAWELAALAIRFPGQLWRTSVGDPEASRHDERVHWEPVAL